jgi:hypothetical protein
VALSAFGGRGRVRGCAWLAAGQPRPASPPSPPALTSAGRVNTGVVKGLRMRPSDGARQISRRWEPLGHSHPSHGGAIFTSAARLLAGRPQPPLPGWKRPGDSALQRPPFIADSELRGPLTFAESAPRTSPDETLTTSPPPPRL